MISQRKKLGVWFIYIPVAIAVLYFFVQDLSIVPTFDFSYLALLALGFIINLTPIRHNYTYYTFIGGISLVTYVIFGLVSEIILSSIAVIVMIVGSDIRFDQHYRYPINLLISTFVSVMSAAGYEFVNWLLRDVHFYGHQLIPLISYMFVSVISNLLLVLLFRRFYSKDKNVKIFGVHLKFLLQLCLMTAPFAYIMLYLHDEMGLMGILIAALPYLILAIGAKYYYRVYNHHLILLEVNHYLRKLSKKTNTHKVIESFIKYLMLLFPTDRVVFANRNSDDEIVVEKIYEKNKNPREPQENFVFEKHSKIYNAVRRKEMAVYLTSNEWQTEPMCEEDYQPESIVVLPLNIMSKERGVLLMSHQHQGVYDDFFVSLIEVFYNYAKIILNNAYSYEVLEESNFTDYLTGLPNFRGFTTHFETIIDEENYETLSLIIMDLDHFKKVNDIHGHQAGNEVLKQVAKVLESYAKDSSLVARYGGEEFVVLLKDAGRVRALETAEKIRSGLEKHPCVITQSIVGNGSAEVNVTASIGVATYPDNTDNVYDLVRLADDVMYTEAKLAGRNMVSEYKENTSG